MTSAISKHDDGTIELTVTLPWPDVERTYQEVVNAVTKQTEVSGFRKGKAPKKLVEDKLDSAKIYEEVVKQIVPNTYREAIEAEKIRPAVTPKVELVKANEGEDWVLRFLTCEKPNVELSDYKGAIRSLKGEKQKNIWTPGEKATEDEAKQNQKPSLDAILSAVLSTVKVTIPSVMAETEVTRLLSDLVDQVRKLGLTVEQYLSSTNRTPESIRKEYEAQAHRMIALELALEQIADKENIFVADDEIEAMIKSAKTDEEKKTLERDRYYLASILRRQKTLDFLAGV